MKTYYGRQVRDKRKGNRGFQAKCGRFGKPFSMPGLWLRHPSPLYRVGRRWKRLPIS